MSLRSAFHLLLVEGDPGDADMVRTCLTANPEHAFTVTHVTHLQDAIDTLARTYIDVVILDLYLPDASGIDTLRQLQHVGEDVAIIVLCGGLTEELRSLVYREGAQDVLSKDDLPARLLTRSVLYAYERHRAQAQQRNAEKMIAASPDAMLVVDTKGVVQFMNQAAQVLFHTSPEEFLGERLGFSVKEGHVAEIEIVRNGMRGLAEMRVVDIRWHGHPAFLATMRDITEQKLLREQLQQAQKLEAIGQLAGGIAHDFNNLLMVILGSTDMMLSDMPATAPWRRWAQEIHTAATRGASLVQQLLAFSRKSLIAPVRLNLNRLVSDMHQLLLGVLGEDIELRILPALELGLVMADPAQLEQVLMNLVLNARDAMPTGGKLYIEVEQLELPESYCGVHAKVTPGTYARLSVRDTGVGMSPEVLAHIFEPFFTTKAIGSGTGLGLATAYGIVQQSGGYIDVESTPGVGTTFHLYLPILDAGTKAQQSAPSAQVTATGTETILLVEDDDGVRTWCRLMLEKQGYHVLEACHSHEALQYVRHHPYAIDLLLTDVVMPQMNGQQLAATLRLSLPNLRVLYMSGYTNDAVVRYGVLHKQECILHKPFTAETLAKTIREVLDSPLDRHEEAASASQAEQNFTKILPGPY